MSKIHQWGGEDISYPKLKCGRCRDLGLVKVGEISGTISSHGPTDVMQPCPDCQEPRSITDP